MMKYFLLCALWLCALPAYAANYQIDYSQSSLAFAGSHAGEPFSGTFGAWQATINFDPEQLAQSNIDVTIDLASAKTGNSMYDGTLPTADWFDVAKHPKATFVSDSIVAEAEGYRVSGKLTLRGITKPVQFSFTLTPDTANPAHVKATTEFTIDRLAFDIGKASDAKAEWVSKDIQMSLSMVAKKL